MFVGLLVLIGCFLFFYWPLIVIAARKAPAPKGWVDFTTISSSELDENIRKMDTMASAKRTPSVAKQEQASREYWRLKGKR